MKFTVLIPVADNSGKKFPKQKLRAIFDRFGIQFGGQSVEGPVDGMWCDDGVLFHEQSYKITVVTDVARIEEARELVREIGRDLGQLAMYFEVVNEDGVEFLRMSPRP